jgi:hypothetical protein
VAAEVFRGRCYLTEVLILDVVGELPRGGSELRSVAVDCARILPRELLADAQELPPACRFGPPRTASAAEPFPTPCR